MNGLLTSNDDDRAREAIEMAIRDNDFCATCGMPMVVAEHGNGLWIECASIRSQRGIRRALAKALHDRHPIDVPVASLAA